MSPSEPRCGRRVKGVVISEDKRIFVSKGNSSWGWNIFFLLVGTTICLALKVRGLDLTLSSHDRGGDGKSVCPSTRSPNLVSYLCVLPTWKPQQITLLLSRNLRIER